MKKNKVGFTLIEVLIALMIIAIALAATVRATNDSIRATIHVRNTTIAHYVAMNVLSQIQMGLVQLSHNQTALSGDMSAMGKEWHGQATTMKKDNVTQVMVVVSLHRVSINSVTGYC